MTQKSKEPAPDDVYDLRYSAPDPHHAPWCRVMHTGLCMTEWAYSYCRRTGQLATSSDRQLEQDFLEFRKAKGLGTR